MNPNRRALLTAVARTGVVVGRAGAVVARIGTAVARTGTVVALTAAAGCDAGGTSDPVTPKPTLSAHAGMGGPASPPPSFSVSEVSQSYFNTPSKNIYCYLDDSAVRCDIVKATFLWPDKPAACELDWGGAVRLGNGKARVLCHGDTLIGTSKETLAYGTGVRSGSVECDSASTGLTCKDLDSGSGFTLSQARYRIF
ncbi:DUF6636 domain-containing protein [Actinoplanes sp. CA-030573]|uniref:DUF6636 domain-containing protein n=1 Tax=Actinoplanes sp. CA-030573 TaxID=3239898 RepID=UPI003D8A8E09